MTSDKYFFSASTQEIASLLAKEMNIDQKDWVYVPLGNRETRKEILISHYNVPKNQLIGEFSDEERHYLAQ